MSTRTSNETTIEADPNLPTIRITREFDAPAAKVFRAYTDRELYAKWIGPRSVTTDIQDWDASTGGSYRFTNSRDGELLASFYGSFHEVRDGERIVQTFTYEGYPDGVSLETMTFEDLGDGRSRIVGLSVVDTMEARDAMIASGMETGVVEGYQKLDELLADL
ncbi:SRPBCC family protein [Allokutzneria sp. NRRL B-24872]|uniref:SRPBCC family protein n=1 Tax=Allokutzneria sp. NRRL B-24872 TaxID=1137961 RepID=UPI000A3A4628|nr:SRPBCC family protein [Allokutzneria sp. NRRL B-24872]